MTELWRARLHTPRRMCSVSTASLLCLSFAGGVTQPHSCVRQSPCGQTCRSRFNLTLSLCASTPTQVLFRSVRSRRGTSVSKYAAQRFPPAERLCVTDLLRQIG